jgi:hypothetical protein
VNIYMPHQGGCGTFGFEIGSLYFDISFPPREGWGWSWGGLVRIYCRHYYLYLPSLRVKKPRY